MTNPVLRVQALGQSIWYDNIRRGLITSGELFDLVNEGGVLGVTSNPSIFEKAIAGSADYDQVMAALVKQGVGDAKDLYERIAIGDIQLAADVLHPVYERTAGADGFVSLEVSPHLAHDAEGTLEEGRRLHSEIGRENIMIKVPATDAGLVAIRKLIGEGISVNVTLIFAVEVYRGVADAYLSGLEDWCNSGGDPAKVASVASFFISRIDAAVDDEIGLTLEREQGEDRRTRLKALLGSIAIANARVAYSDLRESGSSERWQALAERGARCQRLLWASTGTKNPKYPKTLYIDELIGPDTVNTVPTETFNIFQKTGDPRPALTERWEENLQQARQQLQDLADLGISLSTITTRLLEEGLASFSDAFDKLLSAVEKKRRALLGGHLARHELSLGAAESEAAEVLDEWRQSGKVRRMWQADTTLWTSNDEDEWLGWLHGVEVQAEQGLELGRLVERVRREEIDHVVLLGMGGSSLCPDVLRQTLGSAEGFPELLVLDSVVPSQIRAVEAAIDPARTLFIVSSKSGGTTETDVLRRYFTDRVREFRGDATGARFVAVTDPGTALHRLAKSEHFGSILHGVPSIGGRYSALSNFGMVPAALMGVDVDDFLSRTEVMVHSCASCVPPAANPGVTLGVALGTLAMQGRNKLTVVASPGIASLGTWIEQLVAESTGKLGIGLVPIEGERVGPPEFYAEDRIFVHARVASDPPDAQDAAVDELEKAGFPVVRLSIDEVADLGQAFFRWEVATAVVGSLLEINPFDQPDVESAKVATREITVEYEKTRSLPVAEAIACDGDLSLFADAKNAEALWTSGQSDDVDALITAHLGRIVAGDYFAIQAFLEMSPAHHEQLQSIRHAIRDSYRVATTLGYGPRFLHSTGQLHKGGPNIGVFLQLTSDDAEDLAIPGRSYTFGVLKQAQALGDMAVLAERGRRFLRVHLGSDTERGLMRLREIVESAL